MASVSSRERAKAAAAADPAKAALANGGASQARSASAGSPGGVDPESGGLLMPSVGAARRVEEFRKILEADSGEGAGSSGRKGGGSTNGIGMADQGSSGGAKDVGELDPLFSHPDDEVCVAGMNGYAEDGPPHARKHADDYRSQKWAKEESVRMSSKAQEYDSRSDEDDSSTPASRGLSPSVQGVLSLRVDSPPSTPSTTHSSPDIAPPITFEATLLPKARSSDPELKRDSLMVPKPFQTPASPPFTPPNKGPTSNRLFEDSNMLRVGEHTGDKKQAVPSEPLKPPPEQSDPDRTKPRARTISFRNATKPSEAGSSPVKQTRWPEGNMVSAAQSSSEEPLIDHRMSPSTSRSRTSLRPPEDPSSRPRSRTMSTTRSRRSQRSQLPQGLEVINDGPPFLTAHHPHEPGAALRRVFIGPMIVAGKGANTIAKASVVNMIDASSSSPNLGQQKPKPGDPRSPTRKSTAISVRSGRSTGTKWMGASFEIGKDVREAAELARADKERIESERTRRLEVGEVEVEEPEAMSDIGASENPTDARRSSIFTKLWKGKGKEKDDDQPAGQGDPNRQSTDPTSLSADVLLSVLSPETKGPTDLESQPLSNPRRAAASTKGLVAPSFRTAVTSQAGSPGKQKDAFFSVKSRTSKSDISAQTQPSPSSNHSNASVLPTGPPLEIEERHPELVHELFRVPSDDNRSRAGSDGEVERQRGSGSKIRSGLRPILKSALKQPAATQENENLAGDLATSSALPDGMYRPGGTAQKPFAGLGPPVSKSAPIPPLLQSKNVQFPSSMDQGLASGPLSRLLGDSQSKTVGWDRNAPSGDQPAATASSVLARPDLSSGEDLIRIESGESRTITKKSILKADRMLVRVGWTQREDLPKVFDENAARQFEIYWDNWEEQAVVWRPGRLELWTEYKTPFREQLVGHKKYAHMIPLREGKTFLSLYSSVDSIFCLTFPPTPRHYHSSGKHKSRASLIHLPGRKGTNIFVFRARASSMGADWMFELWRELGGTLPENLEVKVPGLGVKIMIPVPEDLEEAKQSELFGHETLDATDPQYRGEGYKFLTPDRLTKTCLEMLQPVPDWKELLKMNQKFGVIFKLAWRRGELLDWIWCDKDGEGVHRDCSVMYGTAMKQPSLHTALELRPALHYPQSVRMPDGNRVAEPPAIEGYLTRVKAKSREKVYLHTHGGQLFISPIGMAKPPEMPFNPSLDSPAALSLANLVKGGQFGSPYSVDDERKEHLKGFGALLRLLHLHRAQAKAVAKNSDADEMDSEGIVHSFSRREKERQFRLILDARGYLRLRDIVEVRRLGDTNSSGNPGKPTSQAEDALGDGLSDGDLDSEFDDVGGEEGLAGQADRQQMRLKRTIELEMTEGRTVRFEAHSRSVAGEWQERLKNLIKYWSRRERIDAEEQMEIHPDNNMRIKQLKLKKARGEDAVMPPPDDPNEYSPLLAKVFNWCTIEGCRGIVRHGRLYHKTHLHTRFIERYNILIGGHLIHYQVIIRDIQGRPSITSWHRKKGAIHLRDCYVYSGSLCDDLLANTPGGVRYDPTEGRHKFPRIYQDGLLSGDDEEDCTFIIWKKTGVGKGSGLGSKSHRMVFRARSKIERDEWVYALNCEIERLVREDQGREKWLKDFGGIK